MSVHPSDAGPIVRHSSVLTQLVQALVTLCSNFEMDHNTIACEKHICASNIKPEFSIQSFCEVVGFGFMKRYASWLNVYALGDAELKLLTKKSVSFNKRLLLLVFGVWIGLITSFVGPIAFVGIVVPNILKLFFKTSNVNKLLPMTVLFGAILVLLADLIARGALGGFILPLNAVLSVLGVPVIVYFLIKRISGVRS